MSSAAAAGAASASSSSSATPSSKKSKAGPAEDPDEGGIPVESLILAKWRDGTWRKAVLIAKSEAPDSLRPRGDTGHACVVRPRGCANAARAQTPPTVLAEAIRDSSGDPTGRFNYYVHYEDVRRSRRGLNRPRLAVPRV